MREWLLEGTTHLGKALWTVIVGNNSGLASTLITWSNKTLPSVMSLISSWRNSKYTFDVQLLFQTCFCLDCSMTYPWLMFLEPFLKNGDGGEYTFRYCSKRVGFFLHTWRLSWQCSWVFCRLVQEARVLQGLHAIFQGSYGISSSKDNLIHIQFHMKIQNKKSKKQQYTSYFKKVLCQPSSSKIVLTVFPVSPAGIQKWVILLLSLERTDFPSYVSTAFFLGMEQEGSAVSSPLHLYLQLPYRHFVIVVFIEDRKKSY